MQELLNAVKQIKQTIQNHRTELANNEALTRYAIVDVLLMALGWDVHDPNKVFAEYTKGMNGRADYALLGENKNPVAIVEAKKLGHLTTQDLLQVTNYAYHSGIRYSLATDGNIWIAADAFKQVPSDQKEIMRFSLENEPENILMVKLVSLLPTNFYMQDRAFFPEIPINYQVPQVSNVPAATPQPEPRKTPAKSSTSAQNAKQAGWTTLSKISAATATPSSLKFPDGSIVKVTSYSGVLKQIAEWLLKTQKLPSLPFKDVSGKTRYLINTTATHADGNDFSGKTSLANGVWLETNYSASNSTKNTLWLLQQAGENPDSYYFQ